MYRLDFATGKREAVLSLKPADASGVLNLTAARVSKDGKTYAYSYPRLVSKLFVVTGVK